MESPDHRAFIGTDNGSASEEPMMRERERRIKWARCDRNMVKSNCTGTASVDFSDAECPTGKEMEGLRSVLDQVGCTLEEIQ